MPVRAPWHPGRFLSRNYLAPLGLSQSQAARLLGLSRRRLHEVVHGQRAMTPDTAVRCAIVFRTDAMFWLALQAAWDSFHAWKSLRADQAVFVLRAPALALGADQQAQAHRIRGLH